jgi:hypothetical protein
MLSAVKTAERRQARELRRKEGRSVREIADLVGVSRATVSLWVRDIELTAEQHAALLARNPAYNGQRVGAQAKIAKYRALRHGYQQKGRALARRGDPIFAAGCMLYWAEGTKARNQLRLSNSDPELVRFFVNFLRTYFDVSDENLRITCHLFADHLQRQREVEGFWLKTLRLPESCLCQSIVNVYSRYSKRKRDEHAPVRNVPRRRLPDESGTDALRRDPGVRLLRSARVARLA